MTRKILILLIGLSIFSNAFTYKYTIDFDEFDFSPFFATSKMFDSICKDNILATDIESKKNHYKITTDVPGIDKKNISVTFKEGYLKIKVTIPNKPPANNEYILKERIYKGELSRSFKLSDADPNGDIKVNLKNGTLNIEIPKSKEKATREIKIM
jgi:HSP20 family protein